MNRGHYSTKSIKRKAAAIGAAAVIIAVTVYAAAAAAGAAGAWREPDAVYPMANSRISWSQTYHAGPWGE